MDLPQILHLDNFKCKLIYFANFFEITLKSNVFNIVMSSVFMIKEIFQVVYESYCNSLWLLLKTYRGQFDWQNITFMNIDEAGETNLLPIKSYVTKILFNINDEILEFSYYK